MLRDDSNHRKSKHGKNTDLGHLRKQVELVERRWKTGGGEARI